MQPDGVWTCRADVAGVWNRLRSALGNAAHSFGASEFFGQIRRQPCVPLVRMLGRRITTFERRGAARLRRRAERGDDLSRALAEGMVVGEQNSTHTYWVLPVRIENREVVVAALRSAGFDATTRSSLIVVPNDAPSPRHGESRATRPSPRGRGSELERPLAPWLGEIVFLPGGENMPDNDWEELLSILQEVACVAEPPAERELAALSGVSGSS